MVLPANHLESLQRQLRVHEERLQLLWSHLKLLEAQASNPDFDPNPKVRSPEWIEGQRELLLNEIRIHEELITLGQDPKVLEALGELVENRGYARKIARDPKNAARKRGIELPAEMSLNLNLEPDRVQLRIVYTKDLFPFLVIWNSDTGFVPPNEV